MYYITRSHIWYGWSFFAILFFVCNIGLWASPNVPNSPEYGFFSPTSKGFYKIERILDIADRELSYDVDRDKFDIGLGRVFNGARSPILLNLDELSAFLKKEKHKKLLVIWLGLIDDDKKAKALSARVAESVLQTGYTRVVVLGGAGNGTHYLFDTIYEKIGSEKTSSQTSTPQQPANGKASPSGKGDSPAKNK